MDNREDYDIDQIDDQEEISDNENEDSGAGKKGRFRKKAKKEKEPLTFKQKVKRGFKIFVAALAVLLVAAIALFIWLAVTEYKPADREILTVEGEVNKEAISGRSDVRLGDQITLMTWNVGYGALGDNADFFMDGGKHVNTASKKRVTENLKGIVNGVNMLQPDVVFLQEVDTDSSRSHGINEVDALKDDLNELREEKYVSSYANNFKVKYIPYPFPPIGKVNSGILTLSDYELDSAERVQLPVPFKWPVRMVNLKRCVMINRTPVYDNDGNDTGKELVFINLHLEAYDDGEGKKAQTAMLKSILDEEYAKGNYVIAAGDFNQTFSNIDSSMYPKQEGKWQGGELNTEDFGEHYQFIMDNSVPTCRSLDQRYDKADKSTFQYYMLDGFIVSDNLIVNYYSTLNMNFANTDHNPVVMSVTVN